MSAGRIDWSTVEVVFVTRPQCPHCHALEYVTTKSEPNGDGTVTRKAICRTCSQPFKISVELPEFGNG